MIIDSKSVETVDEAIAALIDFRDSAKLEGHTGDTVYLSAKLNLVEKTLTDGSKVIDIEVLEAA